MLKLSKLFKKKSANKDYGTNLEDDLNGLTKDIFVEPQESDFNHLLIKPITFEEVNGRNHFEIAYSQAREYHDPGMLSHYETKLIQEGLNVIRTQLENLSGALLEAKRHVKTLAVSNDEVLGLHAIERLDYLEGQNQRLLDEASAVRSGNGKIFNAISEAQRGFRQGYLDWLKEATINSQYGIK
ncbi:MAG: hypothetical protein ACI857_003184 [Arenicella sp.]|jgi:hypothetical protein